MTDETRRALAALDRDTRTRLLATLARRFGDLDLAEDALQDAIAQALVSWPASGVPDSVEAWLTTTAKRKALDAVRREGVLARKLARIRLREERAPAASASVDPAEQVFDEDGDEFDDRLGLFFACAHPVLKPEDRIALTLRFLAGLTTAEVAHALLVPVPTMQQRIVRAKSRIRTLGVPFGVPRTADLPERLACVQRVIYLLYAEGFARSAGAEHVRDDLTAEAIRLARMLHALMPRVAEVTGLLALLVLTQARRPARTDAGGRPVSLAEQDRTCWDAAMIAEGLALAETAAAAGLDGGAGVYAIQSAIAAVHAEAASFETTDWVQIAVLYGLLEAREPSPVVRLGRAVAWGRARGLADGLRLLDDLAVDPVLARFRPFHVARAVTLEELGDSAGAMRAYRRALELPGNEAEDGLLAAAFAGLDGAGHG
ncbi:MAG: sigma-70 family RNA polymerase sigma factor [Propioniciclava sp.]|uniref:RNA polymerase sigma factor n=1 Tax=Propioniciclava sp. TaxID=2038686 RepID=UPI0039E35150